MNHFLARTHARTHTHTHTYTSQLVNPLNHEHEERGALVGDTIFVKTETEHFVAMKFPRLCLIFCRQRGASASEDERTGTAVCRRCAI